MPLMPGARLFHGIRKVQRSAVLVASQGFEPRLIGSEPTVLPLNEEATGLQDGEPQEDFMLASHSY